MKAKNCKSVCRAKLRDFCKHIADERVRKIVEENAHSVTGPRR